MARNKLPAEQTAVSDVPSIRKSSPSSSSNANSMSIFMDRMAKYLKGA